MARKRGKKIVQKVAEEIGPQNERQEDQLPDPDVNMARKRGKNTVQKVAEESVLQNERQEDQLLDPDVERRISAIKAISDVEIEHVLTKLRLLRSYCTKEQRQTPVLEYFKENFPNLSFVKTEESRHLQLQWVGDDGKVSMNGGADLHLSILNQFCVANSGCQTLGGFEFSSKTERSRFLGADNMQIRDFVLEEPFDTQMPGHNDSLQTPGVSSQRLSIGVTPKTLRHPKPGETLLSVHGSPLGVYKEESMEAIHGMNFFQVGRGMTGFKLRQGTVNIGWKSTVCYLPIKIRLGSLTVVTIMN